MHARPSSPPFWIEHPTLEDGPAMWSMARSTGLDENSRYQYLLFCRDFAATSAVARSGDETVGFVTGYRRPDASDTLFVWQIGVLEHMHGQGVAGRMLDSLLAATKEEGVRYLEATVTPDNSASFALFESFARRHGADVSSSVLFGADLFSTAPGKHHDDESRHGEEVLLRIGPLLSPRAGRGGAHRRVDENNGTC